jgi:hypothetical protein
MMVYLTYSNFQKGNSKRTNVSHIPIVMAIHFYFFSVNPQSENFRQRDKDSYPCAKLITKLVTNEKNDAKSPVSKDVMNK